MSDKTISGFSKLSKRDKIKWLAKNFFMDPDMVIKELISYWHSNESQQKVIDGFSENTVSNFVMPYGIAPNFVIDGETYAVPMVIEESSVVAAASAAAKFWMNRGGFHTEILGITKIGHVHFFWNGDDKILSQIEDKIFSKLKNEVKEIVERMEKRGGGITKLSFNNLSDKMAGLFQLKVEFNTCDSMGANFINSTLETFANKLPDLFLELKEVPESLKDIEIIMSILSNYTPECLVKSWVSCPIEDLGFVSGMSAHEFASRFHKAIRIAQVDTYRATTHNKGIFNGVDAVVLATGNDFRAVEACGHAYASNSGIYKSLSNCVIQNGTFFFELNIPLALGTVGGLTALHPMAKRSLEMLRNPSAEKLMSIVAAVGLAQNFAAVRSLVTTGIQKGHMKMHLLNILNHFNANSTEMDLTQNYFSDKPVSHHAVRKYLEDLRKG